MTIRLRPGVKVRPQAQSALSTFEGYISHEPSAIPNHERVYFPDLDVTLTFGHDELDVQLEEGRAFTTYFTNDAELSYAAKPQRDYAGETMLPGEQRDPGDENDWAFAGDETEEVEDAYDDYTIHVGDDFVTEMNHLDNGFHADVYVDEEPLDNLVSFDLYHVYEGGWGGIGDDFVGILLTPAAAYELAEKLMDAADIAEAN
jgi:hypothetical protein